jgi:hypothetical protein
MIVLILENLMSCTFCIKPLSFILFMFQSLEFYKNTLELFQNYVFGPIILSLGP